MRLEICSLERLVILSSYKLVYGINLFIIILIFGEGVNSWGGKKETPETELD